MKIGLLGGSFNPPHQGHLDISLAALRKMHLQQIWWLPNKQNPLKSQINSDFNQRFAACKKLTATYPAIKIKDAEQNISSLYSVDLIEHIVIKYPQHQFFWIMGADNMITFHKWKNWQKIIDLTPLIICDRDNFAKKILSAPAWQYCRKQQNNSTNAANTKCYFLKIKRNSLSSTMLRTSITDNQ